MDKSPLLSSSIFFFLSFTICFNGAANAANSSCPIDFGYVQTFPWDTSLCHDPIDSSCCQTLRSVFGLGLAQYLKNTSRFYLPDANTSFSCMSNFQEKLAAVAISQPFLQCLNDTNEFVIKPSSCAGIVTIQDWIEQVGPSSALDSACYGDLSPCSSCVAAGMKVTSMLVSLHPNSTKCFFFAVLYASGIVNRFGPDNHRTASCILRIPLVRTRKASNGLSRATVIKLVSILLGVLVVVFLAIWLFVMYRTRNNRRQLALHEDYVNGVKTRVSANTGTKWFDVAELERATNGFSQKNMIGQGGHGIVYKGVLSDDSVVAVKQIFDLDSIEDDEFTNEAEIISKIRHRNLLALKGFCVTSDAFQGKRRYLVYDYMQNGSLDDHLFKHAKQLSWPQRKNIILDVANGLTYLHYGIKPAIYHRDIKATNILLDTDMKAKVGDFGLAKQNAEGQTHQTTKVAGTYGYVAPEYALYGQLTEKSDVYSFGIVILEVMSGRKVLDASSSSPLLITDWAWWLLKSGNMQDIFHESIRGEGPIAVMERFVLVGILCAHVMVALRPTIADALKMLEGDIDIPRLPERPLPPGDESFRSSLHQASSTSTTSRSILSISSHTLVTKHVATH